MIDDHRDAAEMTAALLQLHGFRVAVAHDGTSGLVAAARLTPDFVLLDLNLPGALHGTDVARQLRAQASAVRPVIVGLTGDASNYRDARACFDHALTKPLDLAALLSLLRAGREREAAQTSPS